MLEMRTCHLIIGSGPGGAITAALLAEAGRDVLLCEEGASLPLESCEPFGQQEMVQKYRSRGMTVAIGAPKVAYVEGAVVGGGSEVNSALYHRTPADALQRWRERWRVDGLGDHELLDLFVQNEADVTVQLIPGDRKPLASMALHEGALSLGWQSMEVPRWFSFDGTVDCFGVPVGKRQSMSRTFVPRFLKAGGALRDRVRITRIERSGRQWLAFGECQGRPLRVRADTVHVCCGATGTAALLRRSGIRRGVGERLLMHPTIKMVARFNRQVNGRAAGVGVHQVKQFSPRISLGSSISSPAYLKLAMLDYPRHQHLVENQWESMSVYYAMVAGGGHGKVTCLPCVDAPLVRYAMDKRGLGDLAYGLYVLGKALFAAGAVELFPSLRGFNEPIRSVDELSRLPAMLPKRHAQLMTIHLFGSCPMSGDGVEAPCDSFGKVRGQEGLYVNDGSLLCDAPGVNPQGTIMMLARRNTFNFLERT